MHLSELKALHVGQLLEMAVSNNVEGANRLRKHELIFALLKNQARKGESIFGDGTLETLSDGFGFLRSPDTSYLASTDDIYVSPSQIRRFNLHTGDTIEGEIRTPKDGERYFALVKVDKINGEAPEASKNKILFENLTPLHPAEHLKLERDIRGEENITSRIIDIIAPIGKGQRGLLVASPKSGKTVMMQHIAHAITANHPDVNLIVLLIDERPEEVTEMTRSVRGEVVASTFDEPATRAGHLGHFFGALVDEQDDQRDVGMVARDGVCDVLHHDGLAALGAGDQQAALSLADRRDDVDDPAGDVFLAADVTLKLDMLGRMQWRQIFEQYLVLRRLGDFAVYPVNLDQRKVAFTILRRPYFSLDRVAGVQVEAPDLAWTDIDVVSAGEIGRVGRTQEAEPVRQCLQRPVAENTLAFPGLVLEQRENQFVFAQTVGAFDVVADRHVEKLADVKCFEFG